MFLKLRYSSTGREFFVNVNAIDGIEINGTMEQGCVLTLATVVKEVRAHEVVLETFDQIERALWNAGMVINVDRGDT
jgi:hypothetical protein